MNGTTEKKESDVYINQLDYRNDMTVNENGEATNDGDSAMRVTKAPTDGGSANWGKSVSGFSGNKT